METKTKFRARREAKQEGKNEDKQELVQELKKDKVKMIELSCTGCMRTKNGTDQDAEDFDATFTIPFCEEEYYIGFAQRMFPVWYKTQNKYKFNFRGLINIQIVFAKEVEGDNICIGKDIKELTWEELQYLALYKNLRDIQHYRVGSLLEARERAYENYERIVNGKRVFKTTVELSRFKESMKTKEHTISEIEKMIDKSLNMVVNPDNPSKSYSFAKLPSLIVS